MMDVYKSKIINVYLVLAIIVLAALKKQYVVSSMYMAWVLLLFVYVLVHKRKEQLQSVWTHSVKKEKIVSAIVTLIGFLMLGMLEWRKSGLFDFSSGVSIVRIGYICVFLIIVIPSVVLALYTFVFYWMSCLKKCNLDKNQPDDREIKISMGIIVFFVVLFLFSAYPGIFHGDGTNVLRYVLADRWSDWHPITYYAFVYLCMSVIKHPFMVILAQCILFIVTQYLVFKFLSMYAKKNTCYYYTILILTAGISTFSYLNVFYKDTPHFIGLLGFSVSLLAYVKGNRKKMDLIIVFLYAFFTASMRHMSIFIVSVALICAGLILMKGKEKQAAIHLLVGCIAVCAVFFGMKNILISTTETEKNPRYVSFTIPLHMLGSYSASGKMMDNETVVLLNEIMPIEKWEEGYLRDPYFADTLSRGWSLIGDNLDKIEDNDLYFDILEANWRYLCRYPIDYLTDFLDINTLVWEMATPIDGYEWIQPTFANCDDTLVTRFPEYEVQPTFVTSMLSSLLNISKEFPVWRMISYRGGFFNFLIMCAGIALAQGEKQKKDWIAIAPVILSTVLLLISIPAQDPRFILPIVSIGCFVLAYAPNRVSLLNE